MTWMKRALPAVVFAILVAHPALAQVTGRPYEVSAQGGWMFFDTRARAKDAPTLGGSLGWRTQSYLTLELAALGSFTKSDTTPEPNHRFGYAGLDARWHLLPPEERVVPYVITGVGYGRSSAAGARPEVLDGLAGSLGMGLLVNMGDPRFYLRVQARDVFMRERWPAEVNNHFAVTAGVQWLFGGKFRDQDVDGVRDWLDRCPNTPIGCKVDANGCPVDADADSVCDGNDTCPDTPRGCRVDAKGCPVDTDGDGVCDGIDQCESTPAGTSVDERGCPNDTARDNVKGEADRCPDTPAGCTVDASGCSVDADGDGVCDGRDRCPDTPAGVQVDSLGCSVEMLRREQELTDTGRIRLRDVNFASGSAEIPAEAQPTLDNVARILIRWPDLRVEVQGHTDDQGRDAANLQLSRRRAEAVMAYLVQKFPDLKGERFTAKGYGETRPIAPNTTEAGRALNRRVEFEVLNKDAIRQELQRRKMREQTEGEQPIPPR